MLCMMTFVRNVAIFPLIIVINRLMLNPPVQVNVFLGIAGRE